MELKIDPEFQNKIPPLTAEEFDQLKELILSDGRVKDPIVAWNYTIVDGHNRWKIIQENPWLPYTVEEMDFPDKWAAFDWMYSNQLGRRNLTPVQRKILLGKQYEARKHTLGGDRRSKEFSNGQTGQMNPTISETIAKEQHVGEHTVRRAEKFALAYDAIKEQSPETAERILEGKIKPTQKEMEMVIEAKPEERPRIVEHIEKGEKITPVAVPDKIVHKPEAKYTGGGTAEYRAKRNEIAETVARMYDPDSVPEYGIDDFLKEIGWNADLYIKQLRNSITDHLELVKSNREVVIGIIDEIKEDIEKIKGAIDK